MLPGIAPTGLQGAFSRRRAETAVGAEIRWVAGARGWPRHSKKRPRARRRGSDRLGPCLDAAERVNGSLKDDFGGRYVRVRGHAKVFCHLMFGVLALTIDMDAVSADR